MPGSARVSRVGFGVSPKRSLKVRKTGTVSPAPETSALPEIVAAAVIGGRSETFCR